MGEFIFSSVIIWYMATSETPDWQRKPELDPDNPAQLFEYALGMLQWLRRLKHDKPDQLVDGVDHLVERLERYVSHTFDSLPELNIVSTDITVTRDVYGEGRRHIIESAPAPLRGDAELLGEHALKAILYRFYRSGDTVRVYVSTGEPEDHLDGGVYTRLHSVGLEGSDITLAEYRNKKRFEDISKIIKKNIDNLDDTTTALIREFVRNSNNEGIQPIEKLNEASPIISAIVRDKAAPPQVIDALLDLLFLKLDLDMPHDIEASLHRVVLSDQPVSAYRPQPGPTLFRNVVPQMGLIGETGKKGIALFFVDGESAVQIPVQYIDAMNFSNRQEEYGQR